jgi:hypothetical protein
MGQASFLSEPKRHNVLRARALFFGAAWVLSQGVAQFDKPQIAP